MAGDFGGQAVNFKQQLLQRFLVCRNQVPFVRCQFEPFFQTVEEVVVASSGIDQVFGQGNYLRIQRAGTIHRQVCNAALHTLRR